MTSEAVVREAATELRREKPELALSTHNAEWHVRGVAYHFRRMARSYRAFAQGAAGRAQLETDGGQPDVLIMYAPSYQDMIFDFYALVSLARIALDSLRSLLSPVFQTAMGQIPKSLPGVLRGTSDCPLYEKLRGLPDVAYLCDLRDCLVHFHSLATSDNLIVVDEGGSHDELDELLNEG